MAKKLTNAGQTKSDSVDRVMRILSERDALGDEIKELYTEFKSREADTGFTVKQIKNAVTLLRKGAREQQAVMNETIAFLMDAGRIEEAADEALS